MDSVFRSAREKLEKEHIERKGSGKLKLQQEKKANVAAERQRQAIEASQRARRLKAIEAKMQVHNYSLDDFFLVNVYDKFNVMSGSKYIYLENPNLRGVNFFFSLIS